MSDVIWHDIECGGYAADLPLWRELARVEAGPVLDVGAGAGRVALELAGQGHDVTALDRDAALLAELAARARATGLEVRTELADAAGFELAGAPFGLIVVPMQTIQLLPGRAARAAFLASAREHLASGGLVALALSEVLEAFEVDPAAPVPPDRGERDGWRYLSFPVAIRAPRRRRGARARAPGDRPGRQRQHRRRQDRAHQPERARARGRGRRGRPADRAAGLHRRDRRPPRLDGGDAAWLTASCGSSRCIRT